MRNQPGIIFKMSDATILYKQNLERLGDHVDYQIIVHI